MMLRLRRHSRRVGELAAQIRAGISGLDRRPAYWIRVLPDGGRDVVTACELRVTPIGPRPVPALVCELSAAIGLPVGLVAEAIDQAGLTSDSGLIPAEQGRHTSPGDQLGWLVLELTIPRAATEASRGGQPPTTPLPAQLRPALAPGTGIREERR